MADALHDCSDNQVGQSWIHLAQTIHESHIGGQCQRIITISKQIGGQHADIRGKLLSILLFSKYRTLRNITQQIADAFPKQFNRCSIEGILHSLFSRVSQIGLQFAEVIIYVFFLEFQPQGRLFGSSHNRIE